MAMITEKGQYYRKNMHEDVYLQSFLKNMNLRRSCFNCVFRTVARVSDLTLGDFWGCENIWKDWMENKGYSLIFVQNEKGKKFWNSIQNGIISREVAVVVLHFSLKWKKEKLCWILCILGFIFGSLTYTWASSSVHCTRGHFKSEETIC